MAYPIPNNVRVPASCPPPYLDPDQMVNPGGLSCVVAVGAVDYELTPAQICQILEETSVRLTSAEMQDVGVLVFPNPSKDGFNIQCEGTASIEVFSMDGKMVKCLESAGSPCIIDGLGSGMYLVRIVSSQGSTVRKIVKL